MSLATYIDNEVPAFAEWDSVVEAGASTVSQVLDAAFPERGNNGMRVVIDSTDSAYAQKDYGEAIPAAGDFFFAFWLRVAVLPSANKNIFELDNAGAEIAQVELDQNGALGLTMTDDGGTATTATYTIVVDQWYYVAGRITRAATDVSADGTAQLWVDNQSIGTLAAKDNFDTFANNLGIQIGFASTGTDGAILDYDEIKTGTSYQQAYSPTPASTSPGTRRTLLLALDSADGRAFSNYVVQQTGLPRTNVVVLPNATTTEEATSLANWNTLVEDDIDAWVAVATVVFAKITTFVIGYNVPGQFTVSAVTHSGTSRLMHYGTAFSSATANTLYNPSTVARLTVTSLNAASLYLASRIDADSLANAKLILDASLAAGLVTIPPEDSILYSDDSTYLATVAAQTLRMATAALTTYATDAFVWGDTGSPSFGATGIRVAFADDSADSADTMRATSEIFDAVITNGYASGLGNSETAGTWDVESFMEMLRIGGTLGEAVMVGVSTVDFTAMAIGWPGVGMGFQLGGYNLYRSDVRSGILDDDPVAVNRPAQTSFAIAHVDDTAFFYGITTVSTAGVENTNDMRVIYQSVVSGVLGGPNPNPMAWARAEAVAGAKIDLSFEYNGEGAAGVATGIQVARGTGPGGAGVDWGDLIQTITIIGNARNKVELDPTFAHGETVHLAVRAVTAAGDAGEFLVPEGSPVITDSVGPTANPILLGSQG